MSERTEARTRTSSALHALATLLALASGCSTDPSPPPDAGMDAGPDGGTDAPIGLDAPGDTSAGDSGSDAGSDDAGLDAPPDAPTCVRLDYPVSFVPTRAEREAIDALTLSFETETGTTVTLDDVTAAVTSISGGSVPLTFDDAITDPCLRAEAALRALFVERADFFRMPTDMVVRACEYDALTDAEIVRMNRGTYDGRPLIGGAGNDIVAHVNRSAKLTYYGGNYLPTLARGLPEACLDEAGLLESLRDETLEYTRFSLCVPGGSGRVAITDVDSRTVGDPALFVDASGAVHLARLVDVTMAASRVTSAEINSDLYCCPGTSLEGCVGKTLVVDEIDGTVLEQIPRCHTC